MKVVGKDVDHAVQEVGLGDGVLAVHHLGRGWAKKAWEKKSRFEVKRNEVRKLQQSTKQTLESLTL